MSDSKRYSFIKLSAEMEKEFGRSSEKKKDAQVAAATGYRKKMDKITWIPLTPDIINKMEDCVVDRPARNWKQSLKPEIVKNPLNSRSSTISKRNSYMKKNIKITNINNFLYKTDDEEKSRSTKIPSKNLESIEKLCKLTTARKELFKVPSSKPFIARKSVKNRFSEKVEAKKTLAEQSPLIDIEKAEILLKKKSYITSNPFKLGKPLALKSPKTVPTINITQDVSPSTSGSTINTKKNVRKLSDNSEFEALEKLCDEMEPENVKENISCLRNCLIEHQKEVDLFKELHEKRIKRMLEVLNRLEEGMLTKDKGEMKENLNGRIPGSSDKRNSLKQIEVGLETVDENSSSSENNENMVSPNSNGKKRFGTSNSKSDMRVDLLKSKLSKSDGATSKEQRAQKMYNSLRNTFCLLETPKFNKTRESRSASKNCDLSMRLQNQCLMLLDTPKQD